MITLCTRYRLEFRHNRQSLRVVDVLERGGAGLNLTAEVRDGILNHTGPDIPATLEGRIVRLVDRFAYSTTISTTPCGPASSTLTTLPAGPIALLGDTSSDRIDALVHDLVEISDAAGDIVQSQPFADALMELRAFMFEHIYLGPAARAENVDAAAMVEALFNHHIAVNPRPGRGHRLGLGHDRPLCIAGIHGASREPDQGASVEDGADGRRHGRPGVRQDHSAPVGEQIRRTLPVPRRAHRLVLGRSRQEGVPLLRLSDRAAITSGL